MATFDEKGQIIVDTLEDAHQDIEQGFVGLLKIEDRERLRTIVRRVHLKHLPGEILTNYECDKFINIFGEQYAEDLLKGFRDNRLVE